MQIDFLIILDQSQEMDDEDGQGVGRLRGAYSEWPGRIV